MFAKPSKFGTLVGRTNGNAYQSTQTNVFTFYVNTGFYYSHPVTQFTISANSSVLMFFTEVKLCIPFTASELGCSVKYTYQGLCFNKKFQILPYNVIGKSTLSIC